jgi:hypothetical protein
MGSRLVALRGTISCQLQTRFETIEIADLMKAEHISRTAGGVTAPAEAAPFMSALSMAGHQAAAHEAKEDMQDKKGNN